MAQSLTRVNEGLVFPGPDAQTFCTCGQPATSGAEGHRGHCAVEGANEIGPNSLVDAVHAGQGYRPRSRAQTQVFSILADVAGREVREPHGTGHAPFLAPDTDAGRGESQHVQM